MNGGNVGRRLQQHSVQDAEDRGGDSNAEGQHQNAGQCKAWAREQCPQCVAEMIEDYDSADDGWVELHVFLQALVLARRRWYYEEIGRFDLTQAIGFAKT